MKTQHLSSIISLNLALFACGGTPPEGTDEPIDQAPQALLSGSVLFVANSTTLTAADSAIRSRLQGRGFTVTVKSASSATSSDANGKALVVISSTVTATSVNTKFRNVTVPVLTWENEIYDDMGMTPTTSGNFGTITSQRNVAIATPWHQMAADQMWSPAATSSNATFSWGKPGSAATKIAVLAGDPTRTAIFGYDKGESMPGLAAPARRVGMFFHDTTASSLTAAGWALFDEAVEWATSFHELRVLFVGYNPTDGASTVVDRYFSHWFNGMTVDQFEDAHANASIQAFLRASNNKVRYQIVHKIHDRSFDPYPDGFVYTPDSYAECTVWPYGNCEDRKWLFNHEQWVAENQLCYLATQHDVDEIWVQTPPFAMTWENFMIGPTPGHDVNGPSYITPGCAKHYVVHNLTYDAPPMSFVHTFGHRVEATMNFVTANFRPEDRDLHWERFAATGRYAYPSGVILPDWPTPYCGNSHFSSNSQQHYDQSNPRSWPSTCADWGNFPNYQGTTQNLTCSSWNCRDDNMGWGEYWLKAMPRSPGVVGMTTPSGAAFAFPRDFWSMILYPERSLAFDAAL
jgi:hypothetical protein